MRNRWKAVVYDYFIVVFYLIYFNSLSIINISNYSTLWSKPASSAAIKLNYSESPSATMDHFVSAASTKWEHSIRITAAPSANINPNKLWSLRPLKNSAHTKEKFCLMPTSEMCSTAASRPSGNSKNWNNISASLK